MILFGFFIWKAPLQNIKSGLYMFKSYDKRLDHLKNYACDYIFSLWFNNEQQREKKVHEGRQTYYVWLTFRIWSSFFRKKNSPWKLNVVIIIFSERPNEKKLFSVGLPFSSNTNSRFIINLKIYIVITNLTPSYPFIHSSQINSNFNFMRKKKLFWKSNKSTDGAKTYLENRWSK